MELPNLVGRSLDEVLDEVLARQMQSVPGPSWTVRVVERDGVPLPIKLDYRWDRIDVEVEEGIIVCQHVD